VIASRGCPIGCDFCSVPDLFGRHLRTPKLTQEQLHREVGKLWRIRLGEEVI